MQAVMLILMMNVDSLSNPHVSVPEYVYFSQASNITHRFDPLSLQVIYSSYFIKPFKAI